MGTNSHAVSSITATANGIFSSKAPRPPVPGEEDRKLSCNSALTDGMTYEKALWQSQSLKFLNSGDAWRNSSSSLKNDGFLYGSANVPDGSSVIDDLPYVESSSLCRSATNVVPYAKWAESLDTLLRHSDGVKLYREYLEREHDCGGDSLEFYFACQGLKMISEDKETRDLRKMQSLAKSIYKKFIKGGRLALSAEIMRSTMEKLRLYCCGGGGDIEGTEVGRSVFDAAREAVERSMRYDTYPLFLKSDVYLRYIQESCAEEEDLEVEGAKMSADASSNSSDARQQSSQLLPTLHEDVELRQEDIDGMASGSASSKLASSTRFQRFENGVCPMMPRNGASMGYHGQYHVSYAPTSAQDSASDMQSVSSDALTDDTLSQVDGASSIDGMDMKKLTKYSVRKNAHLNREIDISKLFIPRTQRAPKDCNISETDPERFAGLLFSCLQKLHEEQETMCRLHETIDNLETVGSDNTASLPPGLSVSMLPAANSAIDLEGDAESILDDHLLRIWKSPIDGRTPVRGERTPGKSKSRSTAGKRTKGHSTATLSRSFAGPSFNESNVGSTDYAISKDLFCYGKPVNNLANVSLELTKESFSYGRCDVTLEAPQLRKSSQATSNDLRSQHHEMMKTTNFAQATSGFAFTGTTPGYGMAVHLNPTVSQDPVNAKVLDWMLSNEVSTNHNVANASTDASEKNSSNKKSSNKSSQQKSAGHRGVTAGFGERLLSEDAAPLVLPSQPIMQDPLMPPLNPPNPTTQLEEAKRRLAEQSRLEKYRSKDKRVATSPSRQPPRHRPVRPIPPPILVPLVTASTQVRRNTVNSAPLQNSIDSALPVSIFPTTTSVSAIPACIATPSDQLPTMTPGSSQLDFGATVGGERLCPPGNENLAPPATVVGYYFCGDSTPYRCTVSSVDVTLGQFKQLLIRKGNYRYSFRTSSDQFEPVMDDDALLPKYLGKIVGKVEK